MDSKTRLAKTDKGKEEINHRRHKLPNKLRTLLILVDGTRSFMELTDDCRKLGAPEDGVDALVTGGFIAPVGSTAANDAVAAHIDAEEVPADEFGKFRIAKHFMNETAVDNLGGLKKFTFTLKLERCSVRQDLAELLPDYEQALSKAVGAQASTVLSGRMKQLLAV